ncbi:riboflavin kinase [Mycena maculata]|uniref:Riboflavin kinase n=1 Tax=Mycena maculata TaxID=230809 RepID=A0AAD7MUA8_9AGAR|nr:riboflavin kinase [Mycena maculata]
MTPIATVRPLIIGSSTALEAPYPLQMQGKVIRGFGRGSKLLGIPTANLPVDDSLAPWIADIEFGVYFGWASLRLPPSCPNQATTSSDTITHSGFSRSEHDEFEADFYGVEMRLLIAGFIREERDYDDLRGLIADIRLDCDVARKSLDREAWALRETGNGTLDGSWLVRAE